MVWHFTCLIFIYDFVIILGGNPLLMPVDDEDLLAEEDDEDEGDKVQFFSFF